jgi:hypothetical protein
MNGQTKKSLSSIAFEFKNNVGIIEFYGGEFYGLSNLMIKKISEDIKNFANYIKLNPSYGNTFTEEHILSVIYALNKEKILDKNQIIKRVWTADTYTNIDDSENLYTILHYPAEKKKFFKKIYQNLQKNYDFFRDKSEDELKKIALSPIYKRLNPGLLNRIIIFAKTYIKKKLSVIKK